MPSSGINYHRPLLLIDKKGQLGTAIITNLPKRQVVIFITNANFVPEKNVILLPYGPIIPRIPDNTFSQIVCVDFDDKQMKDFSVSLFQKAKETNSKIVLLKSVYALTIPFLRVYKKIVTVSSLVLYADIVSPTVPYSNRAEAIIYAAVKHGKVVLPHSGIDLLYPVIEKDFLSWFNDILFGNQPVQTYCLFPQIGITELTLARYLHAKIDDLIVGLRENNKQMPNLLVPSSSVFATPIDYSFKERLQTIDITKFKDFGKISSTPSQRDRERKTNKFLFVTAGVLLVVFLICLSPLLFAGLGGFFLQQGVHQLETGQISEASAFSQAAGDGFSLATQTDEPLLLLCNTIGLRTTANTFRMNLASGNQLSTALQYAVTGVADLKNVSSNNNASTGLANIKFALTIINQLEADNALELLSPQMQDELQTGSTFLSQTFPVLPDLLGLTQSRHYIILFLNNNELRPGGGFIGSYADVHVQNARIQQMTIHDVYDADGQLQGHVDPPAPLQRYLGVSNWFLRDSNFSVDPNENSKVSSYFYSLETGKSADGIMTVDTSVITRLLQLTGPIAVPEYKQTVTADNFFQLTEDHAEQHFFPGSLQKQNFLSAFYQALEQHLATQPLSMKVLINLVLQSSKEKHITFYVNNASIQDSLDQTLLGESEQSLLTTGDTSTIADFFGENEANVGANKVNHYIQRQFQHLVTIDTNGTITHKATIQISNTSTKTSPYGGDYKVYVRLIIPKDAILMSLQINGQVQVMIPPDQTTNPVYKGKQVLQQSGLTVFNENVGSQIDYGFYLEVPQLQKKTVILTYTLPQKIDNQQSYALKLFKQPGTEADPMSLSFQISSPFHIITVNQRPSLSIVSVQQQVELDTDKDFSVVVSK